MARLSRFAFPVAALLFFTVPGHPDAWFSGVPVGVWTLALIAVLAFAWGRPHSERPRLTGAALITVVLLIAKIAVATMAPSTGWLGRYYANGEFAGAPRRSTEFARLAGATRIDRAIDFHDDYLPLYFLNDADFNRGMRREVTEPISVAWTGHTHSAEPVVLQAYAEARGALRIEIDGSQAIDATTAQPATQAVRLPAGDHVIDVRYVKPANTDPLVRVDGMSVLVTPFAVAPWRLALAAPLRAFARVIDVIAIAVFGYALWAMAAAVEWSPTRVAAAAMLLLFVAQGVQAAIPLQRHALSLSGGDDWLSYEARARAVATGDLLLLFGQPLGKGDLLGAIYPGYVYFVGAVHALGGEDLSTVILVHFLLLYAANVMVFRIASRLFDRDRAAAAVAAVVIIEELAFMRHYTVTLLSENLYYLTVALTIHALVRFAETNNRRTLAWAGVMAGVSALVRPAMLVYLGPVTVAVTLQSWRRHRTARAILSTAALFGVACLLGILPVTLRNYVATGHPTLILEPATHAFIFYNLPPTADAHHYLDLDSGGVISLIRILGQITLDHPGDMLRVIVTKVGFSFGFIHWMGGKHHPELLIASAGYFLALLWCPAARSALALPVHLFVLAHVAGLMLVMPSNYGYRLVLPIYLFLPIFGVHFVFETSRWALGLIGRRPIAAVPAAGGHS